MLRDILNVNQPFGSIAMLLVGDFRQILAVVRLGHQADIVDAATVQVLMGTVAACRCCQTASQHASREKWT